MVKPSISRDEMSVVLVGRFNPAIFHPAWLYKQGLISDPPEPNPEDLAKSTQENMSLVHPEMTAFKVGWLQLQVLQPKLVARTTDASALEPLKDFVKGVLMILSHTPVLQMGINRTIRYGSILEKDWHAIGHKLTPKAIWEDSLEKPGMVSLKIEGVRSDEFAGGEYVEISSSRERDGVDLGVNFAMNSHIVLGKEDGANRVIEILDMHYATIMEKSRIIAATTISKALKTR